MPTTRRSPRVAAHIARARRRARIAAYYRVKNDKWCNTGRPFEPVRRVYPLAVTIAGERVVAGYGSPDLLLSALAEMVAARPLPEPAIPTEERHDALLAATRHHLREHPEHARVGQRHHLCQALEALGFGHVTEGEAAVYR